MYVLPCAWMSLRLYVSSCQQCLLIYFPLPASAEWRSPGTDFSVELACVCVCVCVCVCECVCVCVCVCGRRLFHNCVCGEASTA